jgi:hypothetical protein
MRWFWTALVIIVLLAVDRAYSDGQAAHQLYTIVQWIGGIVRDWADDLVRPLRR